ncbi:MBL fold metallo-hydrolase [Pilimelia columellifera subsp. columellifera]|uniref:MBL fold metallo-hydrolase n=1 Tax=Pilimelia columellifera subsp. columellifera TaxID=706583 RepID=A0ABN3MZ97_9ACTN
MASLLALGAEPTGARAARIRHSPQHVDGRFRNAGGAIPSGEPAVSAFAEWRGRGAARPDAVIPVVRPDFADRPADGLHAVWLGHAAVLVEMQRRRVLIDPIFSDRCSPVGFTGPRRLHPSPLPLADLPEIDAIVISHDHYDHLDLPSIVALTRRHAAPFLVPLGVGAHLERWGVPPDRIIELDWHESARVAGLTFTATPAHHFSGRGLTRDRTLWASWVIAGGERKVFYTGDSGYFAGYADIGRDHGPFDLTLMQVGAYSHGWPDIHMTPEQGLRAHHDVRGGLLLPVHWATFRLAFHSWAEPVQRLAAAAASDAVSLVAPRPGERLDVDAPPRLDAWWDALVPAGLTAR